MEHKTNSCPKNVCKKICRAFNISPAIFRRIRNPPNQPAVAAPKTEINPISSNNIKPKTADCVPISFDYSSVPSQIIEKNTHLPKYSQQLEKKVTAGKSNSNSGVHIEDRLTEFINSGRVKIGICEQTSATVKKDHNNKKLLSSEICSMKDRFSDYIDRTKKKLSTTSTVGVDKTPSFK